MTVAIRRRVTVQPGGRVEVRAPDELRPGEQAEIIILLEDRTPATTGAAQDSTAARDRLRRFAGSVNGGGDPRSADNDRIDADLARAYAATHDDGSGDDGDTNNGPPA